ncbi:MAG: BTAD domain-containing putative transcriptional regulator [Aggregatilineales bacterium]
MLEIFALGYPHVVIDERLIEKFLSTKVIVLLCYLAMNPQTHARERLAALLWGDMPDSNAKSNLRQALHNLGKNVGDYLEVSRQSAGMRPDADYSVDAVTLRDVATDPDATVDELMQVVTTYRGSFLEGINLDVVGEMDDWLRTERESLRLTYLEVLERLSQAQMNVGDWGSAQATLLRSLQVEPLDEATRRQLMLALARQGRYEEAISQYNTCHTTLDHELGVLPSEETSSLYLRLRRARNRPADAVPNPAYTFVGRERELDDLDRILRAPLPRLITVTGEGGVGKTRFVMQAVQSLTHQYLDGIVFVSLEGATDLTVGVAEVLIQRGYISRSDNDDALEKVVVKGLQDQEVLLVLDNLEHLVDQYSFILQLLGAAPRVKVLVISRVALNVRPEHIVRLDGLSYPSSEDDPDWQAYDAPTLFLQTATRHASALKSDDRVPITEICMFVEGVPLAIELAAAHAGRTTCSVIAKQLKARYDALVTTMRDVPPRQVSMRATFDYSWDLLNDDEQQALVRLSVFAGATSLAAIHAVTEADETTIPSLVNQSLLRQIDNGVFSMHELLRQYAAELLDERGETDMVCERHAQYYLETLRDSYMAMVGEDAVNTMSRIIIENDNIQAAWRTGIQRLDHFAPLIDQARMTLQEVYDRNGWGLVGIDVFQQAADVARDQNEPLLACHLAILSAFFCFRVGRLNDCVTLSERIFEDNKTIQDHDVALNAHTTALKAAMRLSPEDERTAAHSQGVLQYVEQATHPKQKISAYLDVGFLRHMQGQLEDARRFQNKALTIARENGLKRLEAIALGNLGIAIGFDDVEKAAQYIRESLQTHEVIGDLPGMAVGYHNLAICSRVMGDRRLQEECLSSSMAIYQESNNEFGVALLEYEMGAAAYEWGNYVEAEKHYQFALIYYKNEGNATKHALGLCRTGHAVRAQGDQRRARNYYRQAAELALDIDNSDLLVEITVGVADLETDPIVATEWLGAAHQELEMSPPLDRLEPYIDPVEASLKAQLSAEDYDAALARGQALDLQYILTTALLISSPAV